MNKLYLLFKGIIVKWLFYSKKRDKSIWLFGEWFGSKCGDNCTYLANYVANTYQDITIYWVGNSQLDTSLLAPSIRHLERGSAESLRIFRRAGAVFIGQGFIDMSPHGYNYFGGSVSVLLWHGIPWKHIGHDGANRHNFLFKLYVILSNFAFNSEFLLSPSLAFDAISKTAFGYKDKKLIKTGLPRNSVFYSSEICMKCRDNILGVIRWNGKKDVKIITYMPTFRDSTKNQYNMESLMKNKGFCEFVEKTNCIIIQKAHQVSLNNNDFTIKTHYDRFYNLNNVDAQSLLCATDVLVTDYSSCFFDYSILNKPIIYFLYDYNYYKNHDRGLYYEKNEILFGQDVYNEMELINSIEHSIISPFVDKVERNIRHKRFLTYETNKSCEYIAEFVRKYLNERFA